MNSPITGKPMVEVEELSEFTIDGVKTMVPSKSWQCQDTKEKFSTDKQDEEFLQNVQRIKDGKPKA